MARRLNRFTERAFAMVADTTGWLIPPDGEPVEFDGIFDNAVVDTESSKQGTAQNGGLVLNRRRPILTLPSRLCVGVSNAWRVEIDGVSYYVADHHPDGKGFMTLWLANSNSEPAPEGDGDGPGWR